jgi:DNA-binding beta-propeller fold protein YncE
VGQGYGLADRGVPVAAGPRRQPSNAVVPISTATNTPGRPIQVGFNALEIAITPDGKTVYVVASNEVVPVNTATNQPGQPIRVPYGMPGGAVITP